MVYQVPGLTYPADALEPYIDTRTMEIHHGKHHAGYVANLNKALEGRDLGSPSIEELVAAVHTLPQEIQTAVRNHGGGHANHSLLWTIMSPKGRRSPSDDLGAAIDRQWGSFDRFCEEFSLAAMSRFGSGWAWLSVDPDHQLVLESTANQDSPLMHGHAPILGIDVWEHAYYLKYQNRRADYVKAFLNVIDWDAVAERYLEAIRRPEAIRSASSSGQ